jgi:hypothetical protein
LVGTPADFQEDGMRLRTALAALMVACFATVGFAQQQTGEIFGRLTDRSGAVLPGATVTVAGPALIQPRVTVTSETGTYRVPEIPIGTYSVTFELPGFRTMVMQDIRITIGFRAQVNAELELSSVQETVTVTGESPLIDTRETGAKTSFDLETLQNIPSARDPWVMLERTPAIAMDRANVGGSQSGQQSNYISRGAGGGNNKWSIDGVDITDMSATGASPMYYDFDMLEEMQVTTGGADASQQTGGVGINFVTRSGTDRFRGSGRYYITDDKFESDNVTDDLKRQGAGSGAPIQNIKDYGFEIGGPIKKGRAWFWGSYGRQDIKAGIVGFYLADSRCQAIKAELRADPLAPIATDDVRSCLGTDGTLLNNYNWKVTLVPFNNNRFNFQNTWGAKTKNARDASDTRPIETTFRQGAAPSRFGAYGWITGPTPFWKAADQHVISDRWLVDFQWAHVGNNFVLDFHEDSLENVQPSYDYSTRGYGRSYVRSGPFLRPTNSVDITTSYFLPGALGGDHAIKAGYRWRSAHQYSEQHWGGNTIAAFDAGVGAEAWLFRDSVTEYHLNTNAAFIQDTYQAGRLTLNLGLRWDQQHDEALESTVPAHPFAPHILPSVTFPGADPGVTWNDISPRLGANWDFQNDGRTVARASYSMYFGQNSPSSLSGILNPVGAVEVDFPWTDMNRNGTVEGNEVDYSRILFFSGNWDPANPSFVGTANTVDPDVKNDRTREFVLGLDRQVTRDLAVGASYIWRKYDRFMWDDRVGFGSEHYVTNTFMPTTAACPVADARCQTVTYYEPTIPIPGIRVRTNRPDRDRVYNGFELSMRKRMSNRWMGSLSYAFNDAVDNWRSGAAYEDPTCVNDACPPGQQYAPESSGSGVTNIFTNAKWLVKAFGQYQLPWDFNVAANYQIRQGFPFPQAVLTNTRANRAGRALVLLEPMGDVRLDSFQILDFRVERAFDFGEARVVPALDVFNVSNANTILGRRPQQNATNANFVSTIPAPRVIRFGVRVQW